MSNIDEEFETKLGKGYNKDKILLRVVDPYMLFVDWEISKKKQEEIKNQLTGREGELILRLFDEKNLTTKSIRLDNNDFLGSYYFKHEHGIKPNTKYFAEIGFSNDNGYLIIVPKSNIVETPSDRISKDTSEEWSDPTTMVTVPSHPERREEKMTLKLLKRTEEQIKKDKQNSEFFHNYFIREASK